MIGKERRLEPQQFGARHFAAFLCERFCKFCYTSNCLGNLGHDSWQLFAALGRLKLLCQEVLVSLAWWDCMELGKIRNLLVSTRLYQFPPVSLALECSCRNRHGWFEPKQLQRCQWRRDGSASHRFRWFWTSEIVSVSSVSSTWGDSYWLVIQCKFVSGDCPIPKVTMSYCIFSAVACAVVQCKAMLRSSSD